jgi:UrcA family protein
MKKHHGFIWAAAASFTLAAAAAPVEDTESVQVRSETVRYDPQEIQDRESAEKLFFRIRQAAEEVCRISFNPRGYERWYEHDCEAEAVSEALADADIPALDEFLDRGPGAIASVRR